jgi:hypothetical protein
MPQYVRTYVTMAKISFKYKDTFAVLLLYPRYGILVPVFFGFLFIFVSVGSVCFPSVFYSVHLHFCFVSLLSSFGVPVPVLQYLLFIYTFA